MGIGRRVIRAALMLMLLVLSMPVLQAGAESKPAGQQPVYAIPAKQTIESGLQQFLERAYKEAEEGQAAYIILDLDTLGGRVDAALEIGRLIRNSKVPTAAFVHGKAISAGSYIALNANKIYMEQGSTIGAAAVVDGAGKEVESAKVISVWSAEMRSAAELRGRNPEIAVGMVDKNREVKTPQLGKVFGVGELVSLTSEEALKVGYSDGMAGSRGDVLKLLGLEGAPVVEIEPTFAETAARFLTNPAVMTLLFMLGLAGIAIELFVPGFGWPGIVGIASFGVYFFGHFAAGFAGVEDVTLFVIGLVLLVVELFVPGFGLWAVAGIICVMAGVIMAAYDSSQAAASLGIGFLLAMVLAGIVIYIFRRRGIWNRFILRDALTTERGYVSQESREELTGLTGRTLTTLRPAGTAVIGGEHVDVVTRGEYIPQGVTVKVLKVEGLRVVVGVPEEEE